MIDGLKPYPEYQESGIAWMGKIPEHWGLPRLGSLLEERRETNDKEQVTDVLSVLRDVGVIPYEEKGNIGNKKSEDITRYKIVRPDDIVVNCMNVIIGSVGLSRYTGCLSPVYYVLRRRAEQDNPHYLNSIFKTKAFQHSLIRLGNGILAHRMRIPMELLKCEPLPRPPADEQAAIVRFLDHADRRIRRYIRAKRQLIALLNEQKLAIIHRAVTRGLDPDVRLKPSGVEWLGVVPEHWETKKLRGLVDVKGGMTPSKAEPSFWDGEMPWVSPKDMKVAELSDSIDHITSLAVEQTNIQVVRPQAVLIVVRGMILAKTFPVTVTTVPVTINQDMKALVPRPTVDATFLRYALVGATPHIHTLVEESGHGTRVLRTELWRDVVLPVPSLNEQKEIASQIQRELDRVDRAEERCRNEIDLLREYRIRLVADVVTGKLDVREAAAHLPEEAEDAARDYLLEDEGVADDAELDAEPEEIDA